MSINRKIAKASIVVGFFTAIVKFAAMGKEIAVAHWFGRGDALDAFLIAILIPSFFVNVVGGSFNAALIPTYVQVRSKDGKEAAQKLFSSVMTFSISLLFLLCLVLAIAAPFYLPFMASGYSNEKRQLTLHLAYLLLPILLISGLVTIWSSILNAGERFALPAWSPVFIPLSAVIFLYSFGIKSGIYALAIGTIVGMAINAVFLAVGLSRQGIHLKFGWEVNPAIKQVMAQYAPMVAGAFLMSGTVLVDQAMAAMLPSGSVAALGYGYKVIALFTGLVTLALSTAILPYFSRQVAIDDRSGIQNTFNTFFVLCLWISVPAMSFIYVFSTPIVRIIFQRGAFTAADTQIVSQVQVFYSFMLPSYIVGILGVRLISAKLGNKILMYGAVINLVTNVVFNIVFMNIYGVAGIALSTSVVYLISTAYIMSFVIFKYGISLSYETVINGIILGGAVVVIYCLRCLHFPKGLNLFFFLFVYGILWLLSSRLLGWKLSGIKEIFYDRG